MRRTFLLLAAIATVFIFSMQASAAEHVVRMLNAENDGSMVFESIYLRARIGDVVRFEPANSGHHVRSVALPQSVATWNSVIDQPFTVKIERAGLYYYICPPHLMMAMIGLIQGATQSTRNRLNTK